MNWKMQPAAARMRCEKGIRMEGRKIKKAGTQLPKKLGLLEKRVPAAKNRYQENLAIMPAPER